MNKYTLLKRATAEFIGTAFLLAIVVGSGIMGERLAEGNNAVTLLANSLATGTGLIFLIFSFAPISGAHFNPAVTLTAVWQKKLKWRDGSTYLLAQICGAFVGTAMANLMFELPAFFASNKARMGNAQFLSELVATFGLIMIIQTGARFRPSAAPLTVAAYVTSAYWFTASTSFANPAVTIARTVTDTFAGIRLADAPLFIIAQICGMILAVAVCGWLLSVEKQEESE